MQVEVLKLGASMGRAIDRANALQSRNDVLRASVASLADDQRIERLAAAQGMVMAAPDAVGFLSVRRGDVARAARNIHTPDPGAFLSLLTSNGAVATAATPPSAITGSAPPSAITASATTPTTATTPTAATALSTSTPATATTLSTATPTTATTPTSATTPTTAATATPSTTSSSTTPPGG
jgi:hypothetical protein